jgi:CRP-like cAMP-binding protein
MSTTGVLNKQDILAKTPLFSGLTPAELDMVAAMTRQVRLKKHEPLFYKGDAGDALYVVVQGVVRISTVSADGRETVLNLMNAGQIFGEIAALDGLDRTADASAMDEVELLALDRRSLLSFLKSNPEGCIRMLAAVCGRLRWVSELLDDANYLELPARLAKRLLLLSKSFGQMTAGGLRISLKLSQQELATHMSASREAINRQFKLWTDEGTIAMESGYVVIRDEDALSNCAEPLG